MHRIELRGFDLFYAPAGVFMPDHESGQIPDQLSGNSLYHRIPFRDIACPCVPADLQRTVRYRTHAALRHLQWNRKTRGTTPVHTESHRQETDWKGLFIFC